MPGIDRARAALGNIALRARQKNSIYLCLSLLARVLNASGMFIAIQRFVPSAFGEMSYFTATAASTVAFCSFGIELSMNAQLTRQLKEGVAIAPTIEAGCTLALAGTVLACVVICTLFASQLKVSSSPELAVLAVCVYASFMIFTSLLTAMSFALDVAINVGVSYMLTSGIFLCFAIFANAETGGVDLMFFLIVAQVLAVTYMALALLRSANRSAARVLAFPWRASAATKTAIKTLFAYGAKQILVVSAVTFSQWLIQRKIVFGDGGSSENAIYSIGNQVFNMMTFIPLIITPIIITRLAAAGDDLALRRSITLRSLRLFAGIAVCACTAVFIGLRIGVPFLPPRYVSAVATGLLASVAAAFQILKSPFSLFFLAELKASREIASATAGALFMIVATSLAKQLHPDQGTMIRLLGCALQAVILATLFLVETRERRQRQSQGISP